jgi:hypothetical protein
VTHFPKQTEGSLSIEQAWIAKILAKRKQTEKKSKKKSRGKRKGKNLQKECFL